MNGGVATPGDWDFRLVVDGVVYSLQRYGGLIRYWDQLLTELSSIGVPIDLRLSAKLRANPPNIITRTSARQRVFHSTYYTPPGRGVPSVVTVHDCIYEELTQLVPRLDPDPGILERKRQCVNSARALVVPSVSTEVAVRRHYPALACPVHVVAEGVTPDILATPTADRVRRVRFLRRRAGTTRPYILHVGGRGEYKNFLTVLRAYVATGLFAEFDLVVVGSELGPRPDEAPMTASLPPLARVAWMGQMSDPDLAALYADAAVMVSASTVEGFGLPVLEAAAIGIPVACSRIPAYLETVGPLARLFDPDDTEGCGRAIWAAAELDRAALRVHGQGLARAFRWREMAVRMTEIYRDVAVDPRSPRRGRART